MENVTKTFFYQEDAQPIAGTPNRDEEFERVRQSINRWYNGTLYKGQEQDLNEGVRNIRANWNLG